MEWIDHGFVLSVRRHGETSAIVDLLTRTHGRRRGLVRGGASRRWRGILQPGNLVAAKWRGRLAEHLGTYIIEPERSIMAELLDDAAALDGVGAMCALATALLPEGEAHPAVYDGLAILLGSLDDERLWPALLVKWELGLLQELGYALDLSQCASTGVSEGLTHVSPRTGRAVCAEAAAPYKGRLLDLPPFLTGQSSSEASFQEIRDGLRLTGYFLERWLLAPHGQEMPQSRGRLMDRLCH